MKSTKVEKTAQDKQDEIFRNMSTDRKLEVAAGLWRLAKELDSRKIDYGANRPPEASRKNREAS